ncbi:MAG: GntR family transcriptional regulator [Clostridiaceae bacterium]
MKIYQNSNEPIYIQISNQFRDKILQGEINGGEYLPSIRELAADLRISVVTTMNAYKNLEKEGLITSIKGKGYYVNAQDSDMLKEQHLRLMESYLIKAIECSKIARISKEDLVSTLKTLMEVE